MSPYSMARRPVFKKSVVNTTYAPVDNFNYQHVTNVISDSYNHGLVPVPVDGASSNIVYVVISDPSMDYESPGAGGEHRYAYFLPGRTNYLNDVCDMLVVKVINWGICGIDYAFLKYWTSSHGILGDMHHSKQIKDFDLVCYRIKIFDSAYYDACLQYSMARRPVFKKSVVNTTYAPVDNFNYQHVTNVIKIVGSTG